MARQVSYCAFAHSQNELTQSDQGVLRYLFCVTCFALLGGVRTGKVDLELEQLASPAYQVIADDLPLLLFHGDRDGIVLLDQSDRIVKLYQDAGLDVQLVVLEGVGHGGKRFFRDQHLATAVEFLDKHRPKAE